MRHDLLWVLIVLAFAWLLLGYNRRATWGYYGYGSGGVFLFLLLILFFFGVL